MEKAMSSDKTPHQEQLKTTADALKRNELSEAELTTVSGGGAKGAVVQAGWNLAKNLRAA